MSNGNQIDTISIFIRFVYRFDCTKIHTINCINGPYSKNCFIIGICYNPANKEFKKMLPLKKSLFKKSYERYPNNDFEELIAAFTGKYF